MRVCVPVGEDGQVGHGWGRAHRVAVADVGGGEVTGWQEYEVAWDQLHDQGTEGSHHARIARFLIEQRIDTVVAGHMGPPMHVMLQKMGLHVLLGASGDARAAVAEADSIGD